MHRTLPATLGVGGLCAHFQMGDTGRRRPSDLPKATLPADSRTRDGAQTWSGKLQLSGGSLQSVAGIGWGGGRRGVVNTCLEDGWEDSIHQAGSRPGTWCQGANPYDGKGTKLGHLHVDEKAREDPLKGQRAPAEGNPVGGPRGVLRCQREEAPLSGG